MVVINFVMEPQFRTWPRHRTVASSRTNHSTVHVTHTQFDLLVMTLHASLLILILRHAQDQKVAY